MPRPPVGLSLSVGEASGQSQWKKPVDEASGRSLEWTKPGDKAGRQSLDFYEYISRELLLSGWSLRLSEAKLPKQATRTKLPNDDVPVCQEDSGLRLPKG